jgi:phosphatidate cytidylyltransferase
MVAALGLPILLYAVYLGGWWIVCLAAVGAVLALHELFRLTRAYRPVVLAGFVGGISTLVGAKAGGAEWMVAGFLAGVALAFLFRIPSWTRASVTVSLGVTTLGTAWIGLGLAHLVLLRELDDRGRLAAFAVILAVFAADTAAYVVGRLVGRHRMAPRVSPGKTWEGFAAGAGACVFVTWVTFYETGFMAGGPSFVLGGALALAAVLGDLFESVVKREAGAKDSGRVLAGHGGMLDRIDALLFASVVAYYVVVGYGAT